MAQGPAAAQELEALGPWALEKAIQEAEKRAPTAIEQLEARAEAQARGAGAQAVGAEAQAAGGVAAQAEGQVAARAEGHAVVSGERVAPAAVPEPSLSVKEVRALLDRPIPPEVRPELEARWAQLQRANAQLEAMRAGANPKALAQAEAELAELRMSSSGTIQGARGGITGTSPGEVAQRNWRKADQMVKGWARSKEPVTLDKIREIHRVLGEGLDHNSAAPGLMRTAANRDVFAGGRVTHQYVPSAEVSREMDAFMSWYQAHERTLPPVELAAGAYQRLVSVPPFMDANGRTCRLVMDWILQRHGLPPAALVGEEVNLAQFALDRLRQKEMAPENAIFAVTRGIERAIEVMTKALQRAKQGVK